MNCSALGDLVRGLHKCAPSRVYYRHSFIPYSNLNTVKLKPVYIIFRRKIWKDLLVRKDVDHLPLENFEKRVLCSLHFSDDAYMCPNLRHEANASLRHDALPSLWPNHPAPPPDPKKRKPPTLRLSPKKKSRTKTIIHSLSLSPTFAADSISTSEELTKKKKVLLNEVWRLRKSLERAKSSLSKHIYRFVTCQHTIYT